MKVGRNERMNNERIFKWVKILLSQNRMHLR